MSLASVDLPPPDWPTSAMHSPAADVDLDVLQHRAPAVGERHVVEVDAAFDARVRRALGPVGDVGVGVEHRGDLDHRRRGRLDVGVDVRELLQRLEDQLQQVGLGDQRADRELAVGEELRADEQHRAGRDHAEAARSRGRTPRRGAGQRRWTCGWPRSARRTAAWNARSRLNAWITAMPATDSAICAVTPRWCCAPRAEGGVRATLEPARQDQGRRQDRPSRRRPAASR